VYLIKNKITKKYYAMKSIRKDVVVELDSIENIHIEKRILLQANHPFIISMDYIFVKSTRIYFIMEYIR
jgi:serum/glucocorticoid-regulated kinase 2